MCKFLKILSDLFVIHIPVEYYHDYEDGKTPEETDANALASDWKKVGDDWNSVLGFQGNKLK